MARIRNLVLVLGDQLDAHSAALRGFDREQDAIWMAEVSGESTYVLSHKVRIAYFLSAMRHFAEERRADGMRVEYRKLDEKTNSGNLVGELSAALRKLKPDRLVFCEAGEYRIEQMVRAAAGQANVPYDERADEHFFCSRPEFADWARGRRELRMEFFYREMRRRTGILMEGQEPLGGRWNFDTENRKSFGAKGPGLLTPKPQSFAPDKITSEVLVLVNKRFSNHPGRLDAFALPVTAGEAERALREFVDERLPSFGDHQDAMWTDEPFLYHARISAAMNLKLLNPRRVCVEVEDAYRRGNVPLAAAEGFIRQILGWREYVRGIYWTFMPGYVTRNALGADEKLPDFYWDGNTDMECLRQAVGQTLEFGYAHHIQRLMVTGLYSMLFGVDPVEIHKWYLAIYWDAVEWVEMPNVIGMSQFADGGLMGSKPYAASGKYISRMSNYCAHCRYQPDEATGELACPFTTMYWDFLLKHEKLLAQNQRMAMQVRNLKRLTPERKHEIQQQAARHRAEMPKGKY